MDDIHLPRAGQSYTHTMRVTFSFDDHHIRIARVQRVAMRVPAPSTPPPSPSEKTVGYWLTVEDSAGKTLYHFPLHDPLKRDLEVFDNPEEGKPFRTPASKRSGEFEVLVPDVPEGARLVLHGSSPGAKPPAKMAHAASAPIVTHQFDELRRLAVETARKPKGGRP